MALEKLALAHLLGNRGAVDTALGDAGSVLPAIPALKNALGVLVALLLVHIAARKLLFRLLGFARLGLFVVGAPRLHAAKFFIAIEVSTLEAVLEDLLRHTVLTVDESLSQNTLTLALLLLLGGTVGGVICLVHDRERTAADDCTFRCLLERPSRGGAKKARACRIIAVRQNNGGAHLEFALETVKVVEAPVSRCEEKVVNLALCDGPAVLVGKKTGLKSG